MSAVRVGFVFALEDEYGKGPGQGKPWIAPPPGSYISTQHNRTAQRIQSTGTKFWDTVAYGKLSGSFTWPFTFDYNYLEPFFLAFEKYVGPTTSTIDSESAQEGSRFTHTYGYYTFAKQDGVRPKPFSIRRKIINHTTNGDEDSDELSQLNGCVIRSIKISKSTTTSQVNVTLSGFYSNEFMVEGHLPMTDYQGYDGQLAEYMCMFTADGNVESDGQYSYVANTDSLELTVTNNIEAIYTTCSPFAKNFYEGIAAFDFSTSCWSNDIHRYKTRVYGGGSQAPESPVGSNRYVPMTKHLSPLKGIRLCTYDGTLDDVDNASAMNIIRSSDRVAIFNIRDTVIKSLPWPKADGSKIQDVISSAECRNIWLEVKVPQVDGNYPVFDPAMPNTVNSLKVGANTGNIITVMVDSEHEGDTYTVTKTIGGASATITGTILIPGGSTYTASGNNLVFSLPDESTVTITPVVAETEVANWGFKNWSYKSTAYTTDTSGQNESDGTTTTVVISSLTTITLAEDAILTASFGVQE